MAFLEPEYLDGEWYVVETSEGTFPVPTELEANPTAENLAPFVEGEVWSWKTERAIGVRLSAPGELDSTEWSLHDTVEAARRHLVQANGVDP